jgi:hypothetical protein
VARPGHGSLGQHRTGNGRPSPAGWQTGHLRDGFLGSRHAAREGRLDIRATPEAWRRDLLTSWRLLELPVSGEIAIVAVELSEFHADPIDRLIVATARTHAARLMTADRRILAWQGPLDRQDARI